MAPQVVIDCRLLTRPETPVRAVLSLERSDYPRLLIAVKLRLDYPHGAVTAERVTEPPYLREFAERLRSLLERGEGEATLSDDDAVLLLALRSSGKEDGGVILNGRFRDYVGRAERGRGTDFRSQRGFSGMWLLVVAFQELQMTWEEAREILNLVDEFIRSHLQDSV